MQGDYLTSVIRRLQTTVRTTAGVTGLFRKDSHGAAVDHTTDQTQYPFVFVHGFFGWGQYDKGSDKLTYWGMFSGDLVEKVNRSGFVAVSASVDTVGSAWDRACELYAQLTGTRVDYGKASADRPAHCLRPSLPTAMRRNRMPRPTAACQTFSRAAERTGSIPSPGCLRRSTAPHLP